MPDLIPHNRSGIRPIMKETTMTDILEFSPKAIMAMGIKRITPLVAKYGITSPEVLAACKRWGGMLDEVNYPDSSCRWCGVAVTHAWEGQKPGEGAWYHVETKSKYCWDGAPAVAQPALKGQIIVNDQGKVKMGTTTGRLAKNAINKKPSRYSDNW